MLKFECGSLGELADYFQSQADGCTGHARKAKTEKQRLADSYAANAWAMAAEIVRGTTFTDDKQEAAA